MLGPLALENHRRYCARHGYAFIDDVPVSPDRPACWAKIPAILAAFDTHEWVLWADSDTLIREDAAPLDDLCDPAFDMVVQSHAAFFRFIGVPVEQGMAQLPISTGVFLMQRSGWSRDFLARAYDETAYVTQGEVWDGIGEQEAMIALLRRQSRRHEPHPACRGPAEPSALSRRHRPLRPSLRQPRPPPDPRGSVPRDARRAGRPPSSRARHGRPTSPAVSTGAASRTRAPPSPTIRGELEDFLYRPEDIGLRA